MFLGKYDPTYVAHMERKREALINYQLADSEEIKPLVSEHYYHDIFVNEFNIHVGFLRSDTCDTCDSLKVKIDTAENKTKLGVTGSLSTG